MGGHFCFRPHKAAAVKCVYACLALLVMVEAEHVAPDPYLYYGDAYNHSALDSYAYGDASYDSRQAMYGAASTPSHNPYHGSAESWSSLGICPNGECGSGSPNADHYGAPVPPADYTYMWDNCVVGDDGQLTINGTISCDVVVSGADAHADLLTGGLDGVYRLVGCYGGKPVYEREDSPPGEARSLGFNAEYGDWEFSVGDEPTVDQLVMYGDYGHVSPLDVPNWHLAAALNSVETELLPSKDEDLYFIAPGISVACVAEAK